MPLYEYECEACGERFELIQKFSDGPPDACVKCGKGPVQRQVSSPAFHLKGSGWYITDYARKGSKPEGESSKGEEPKKGDATAASPSESSGDSKKSEGATPPPAPAAKPSST